MKKFLLFCLLISAGTSFAQSLWQLMPEANIRLVGERQIIPSKYQTMQVDLAALQTLVTNVPERFTPAASIFSALPILDLPTPTGRMSRFRLTESPVMAPGITGKISPNPLLHRLRHR